MQGYTEHELERRVVEAPKRSGIAGAEAAAAERTPFARDRARVQHCAALRRLADEHDVQGEQRRHDGDADAGAHAPVSRAT